MRKRRDQKPRDQYLPYNYLQLPGLLGDQTWMRETHTHIKTENNLKVALIFTVFLPLVFK